MGETHKKSLDGVKPTETLAEKEPEVIIMETELIQEGYATLVPNWYSTP